ncbi:uncharacterized protein LOC113396302 [Vanessa tameamea]|uniref:Uncharacterized protein LOC113396302 n=1 Tax=Vanessa tameamea TaxID=334116 RepID=A0A8B8HZ37_VANTA|nr:uncharacterized protein LOC113396302 [Vanessa tameamea]
MSTLIDNDTILSENEQWTRLEEEWGKPIDLEVDAEDDSPRIKSAYSTLDLKGTTFDSSFLFKKVRRKIGRQLSKKSTSSALEYNDFISNLKDDPSRESSKQFYFINGQLVSAASIENICDTIDDIFKSIDKLSTVTSTVRKEKFPDKVQCSISATDLSFDTDTEDTKYSEIERHIEEAFEEFNSISAVDAIDQSTLDSVTTLVQKFSSVLNDPVIQCSPRRRRQCCEKFKELADFWKNRAFESD